MSTDKVNTSDELEAALPNANHNAGVLRGVKVLELAAIGPIPWASDILMDLGASITKVHRPEALHTGDVTNTREKRGRIGSRNDVFIDLKKSSGRAAFLDLVQEHEILVEGMRPGVLERLGLGPQECREHNPALVYVRVTGWGQTGLFAQRAGHDINYIALSGALHAIGPKGGAPVVPLNLVGDYGSGGAFMLFGAVAALLAARESGVGMTVDVSMLDIVARQLNRVYEWYGEGTWTNERGTNIIDGGAPWYTLYETSCGRYMAVGAIENKFYRLFVAGLGLDFATLPDRTDESQWPVLREIFTTRFLTKTRMEWEHVFSSIDACVSPVLTLEEAPYHPHNVSRTVFTTNNNRQVKASLVPRFSSLKNE